MTARDSSKNVFYTYAHYRAAAPERGPFYIGKGKGPRAWKTTGTGRNTHWQRIAKKHGLLVEIVAKWPTEQEALDHEVFLIECFRHLGTGLVNMTDGGEGLSNPSPEVLRKIRARAIKQWSDPEQRAAMVTARSTAEAVAKKSESLKRAFATKESFEKRSAAVKRSHARPEVKEKMLANAADPKYRATLSASVKAALAKPESKQRKSAASKAMWQDPTRRARFAMQLRQKAEARWATLPPEKAAKLRHAANLDRARKKKRQNISAPTSDGSSDSCAIDAAPLVPPVAGNTSPVDA